MPYAFGITYRAGDYFAAAGPRINENIQQFMSNRRERQQMTTTAEMLARYIKDDPKAMEMFGPELAKIPGSSLGAAKGIVGGLTTYLTQRHLQAAEAAQTQALDIAKQEQALRAGEAAQRQEDRDNLGTFNRYVSQELNPPMSYKDGAPPTYRPPLDPASIIRYAGQARVLGDQGVAQVINAVQNSQPRAGGMKPGEEIRTPSGALVVGKGAEYPPDVIQPKVATPPKGMAYGSKLEIPEGTWIGAGLDNEAKFLAKPDKTKLDSNALQRAQALSTFGQQIDSAAEAVEKFGHDWIRSYEGATTLKQLPTLLATGYYKATDPGSIISQKEIDNFEAKLFPQGRFTPVAVTQAALDNLRKLTAMHSISWSASYGGDVPGLPESIAKHIKGAAPSGPSTASADEVAVISPDGRRGKMRKDKLDEALKNGFKLAQ